MKNQDKSNNTIDPPTTPQPATQENLGIPFQQTRSTRMSSPSKDSEQFGENDGSELSATLSQQSQSLLQPGGTLLGKDINAGCDQGGLGPTRFRL